MTCNHVSIQLTDEQKSRICGVLSVGCDLTTAANFAGCARSDIRRAMQVDPQFAASVRRCEAGVELGHMRTVQEAAKDVKNWRAATWWLERHAPDRYGPRGAGVVTFRQLKAFLAMLAEVLGGGAAGPVEGAQIFAQLKSFSEFAEQVLRDERMLEPEAFDAFLSDRAAAGGPEPLPDDCVDVEFETSH